MNLDKFYTTSGKGAIISLRKMITRSVSRLCGLAAVLLIFVHSPAVHAQQRISDLESTVILISIDGFRADYFEKHQPPAINELLRSGVRARWMTPVFPTKTFTNHYTLVTGLYPDNHGMIENNMYDPGIGAVFGISKKEQVTDPRWWGGEPIWRTAQRQGQISASFFWPGSEAPIGGMLPNFFKEYEHTTPHEVRVDTVLGWLDLPRGQRPRMITTYFSDVDDAGHAYGPDDQRTKQAVLRVDSSIRRLFEGLRARGIEKMVSVILVSDHGMSPYRVGDSIVLDTMFDPNDAERVFWVGEFTQIFPKPGRADAIFDAIRSKLPPTAAIYRNGEFPPRFKFGKNKRIAPIVVVPNEGSVITTKSRAESARRDGRFDNIRGAHGYDNGLESMRAIFVGHGGRFKRGVVTSPVSAIDVYELMCNILKVKPAKNDGSLKRIRHVLR